MADNAAEKLQETVENPVKEEAQKPEKEQLENGEDKEKPQIPDVPIDKEGKRPSDNSIDFDKLKELLPDEVYKTVDGRFKSLYKQVKAQDRYLDQLGKDFETKLSKLAEKDTTTSKTLEKLTDVVSNLSKEDASAKTQMEINKLEEQKAQAYQDMDFTKVAKLDTQIMQKMLQPQKVEVPKEEKKETKQEKKTEEPKQEGFTKREQAYLTEWVNEVDDNYNNVRPWAQENHPLYSYAMEQAKALMQHPQLKSAPIETVLATVDQVMGSMLSPAQEVAEKKPEKKPPQVLDSDANIRTKKNEDKITLTDEQKIVSHRLFPKLDDKDAEKRYLSSLIKLQNRPALERS